MMFEPFRPSSSATGHRHEGLGANLLKHEEIIRVAEFLNCKKSL